MNMNYGRLSEGRIEYAPSSLDTEDGVKMNPSEASYLAAGWKKVVDARPTAEPGYRVEVSGWNEGADTLTCVYKVVPGEAPVSGPRVFSKLKLVAALKEADKWVLVKTWIEGIPRRARCARRVAVGSGERVARTAKQPRARSFRAAKVTRARASAQIARTASRGIAHKGGHAVLWNGVTAFFVYAPLWGRESSD